MSEIRDFIKNYGEADFSNIEFSWNGKHAGEFEDANQDFRQKVVQQCVDESELASSHLLQILFITEAKWARQAWGSPRNFAELGTLLLQRAEIDTVSTFAQGMNFSFDTFGACHEISLSPTEVQKVRPIANGLLETEVDDSNKTRIEGILELLDQIDAGVATEGWVKVQGGTSVENAKVVKPSFFARLWSRITG